MQFDDLMLRYFGSTDIEEIPATARVAAVERMRVDFGLARDPAHRFVLWALLAMNDAAPDISEAFDNEAEREAARNLLDLIIAERDS